MAHVNENDIFKLDKDLISALLVDQTTGKNLLWATDDYKKRGPGFLANDEMGYYHVINGRDEFIVKPRVEKSKSEQTSRSKDKAEVFTPSWVCNKQNNLTDNAWFDKVGVFNTETDKTWTTNNNKIVFPNTEGKTWQDYVKQHCLEVACGEAPYIVSRYDTVSGNYIEVNDRIGILDRKLRVVNENVQSEPDWYSWAKTAIKSVYGYDFQGDNVFLARQNIVYTFFEYYVEKFGIAPIKEYMMEIANIVTWNIWQMDGLKYVVPNSCTNQVVIKYSLFGEEREEQLCKGCQTENIHSHNGIYCKVMDWDENKKVKFVSLIK